VSTIAELCRKEGIHPNLYYKWSKEFPEAGKQRLVGDAQRQVDSQGVMEIQFFVSTPNKKSYLSLRQLWVCSTTMVRTLNKKTYYAINHGAVAFQAINAKQLRDWL